MAIVLEKLGLLFSDKKTENEYRLIQNKLIKETQQKFLFVLGVISLGLSLVSIPDKNLLQMITFAILFVLAIFSIFFWKNRENFKDIIIFIYCSIFYVIGLYATTKITEPSNVQDYFYMGYVYAQYQTITMVPLRSFWLRFFFLCIGIISKFVILNPINVFNSVVAILMDLIFFILRASEDINQREWFKIVVESREELMSYKNLVMNYMPTALYIFKDEISSGKVINKFFNSDFDVKASKDITEKDVFKKILVESTLDRASPGETFPHTKLMTNQTRTLHDELETYLKNSKFNNSHVTLTCFTQVPKKTRYEVKIFPIKWVGETATVVLLNDISLQETILSLKIADSNKEKVIASISHELRTPLHGIICTIEYLKEKLVDKELISYCFMCIQNAKLLKSIINSILDFQKVSKEVELKLQLKKFYLKDLIDEVKNLFEFQCKDRGIYLNSSIDKNVPEYIYSDYERLSQVLICIVNNAVKFTFKGGIDIRVKLDNMNTRQLLFEIQDTGTGITKEIKSTLFKVFGKVERGSATTTSGIGLGLTISSCLVKILSPENKYEPIKVESEVGLGSTFTFNIAKKMDAISLKSLEEEANYLTTNNEEVEPDNFHANKIGYFVTKNQKNFGGEGLLKSEKQEDQDAKKFFRAPTTSLFPSELWALVVDDNSFNLVATKKKIEAYGFKP